VYLLALNWRGYSSSTLPAIDEKALDALAQSTWTAILSRPRLSTVQAGLLLLQRRQIQNGGISDGPGIGAFVGELCAAGRVLGLHLDCTEWRIPLWERGLRRRLGWGLWMCDKWYAQYLEVD
jgi:Fungal specific transcription factor domain